MRPRASQPVTIAGVLSLSAFCALLFGGIEVGTVVFEQQVRHRLAFASFDVAWLAPAATLILIVPLAMLLHGLARAARRPLTAATLFGLLVGVLGFGALLRYGVLAWWASAVLAAGVAIQVARESSRYDASTLVRFSRTAGVVLAVLFAVAGTSVRMSRARAERTALASLPAPPPNAPNVLLIVLDTVRSESLGLYGYGRPTTPQLQRWAESSAVFDHAIAPAPWTLPSHASMFTGRLPHTLTADWLTGLDGSAPTIAEAFRDHGYVTGGFAANLTYASYESGLNRGFVHYDDYPLSWPMLLFHTPLGRLDVKGHAPSSSTPAALWRSLASFNVSQHRLVEAGTFRPADDVASAFEAWQGSLGERPFFAFLNLFDAHGPYRADGPSPVPDEFLRKFARLAPSERDRYDAAIAWLDHVVGDTLSRLQQRGLLDRTVVVITADHGEQFGEHGLMGHGNSLYPSAVEVPLIVRATGRAPAGVRVGTTVSLRDLGATLLDLANVPDRRVPGVSLAGTWTQPDAPSLDTVVAELKKPADDPGQMVSAFDGRFQYIVDDRGREELYDRDTDAAYRRNLASKPEMQPVVQKLRGGLTLPWQTNVRH